MSLFTVYVVIYISSIPLVACLVHLPHAERILRMEASEYEILAQVEQQHWWYTGMRAIADAWLSQLPVTPQPRRILDAGCGTGGNLSWLQRYGTPLGFDFSSHALSHAPRSFPLLQASITHMPFADASFDLVTSFEVIYHRGVFDDVQALKECARVLAPTGHLLLRLPAFNWLRGHHDDRVHGARRYTKSDLHHKLAQAGLTPLHTSYVNTLLLPLALWQRLRERQHTDIGSESDLQIPSPFVNTMARWALQREANWLALGGRFPVGVSVLCLARPHHLT
jgi:SAM-dependent methyltransferase